MKYTITFSCGHEDVVSLFGKGKDRERKIAYYERECVCPACMRAAIDKHNKAIGVMLYLVNGGENMYCVAVGDTYDHKDELKKLGYMFGHGFFNDDRGYWHKCLSGTTKEEILERFTNLGQRTCREVTTHVSTALEMPKEFVLDEPEFVPDHQLSEYELPALKGTVRQIEWATKLRKAALEHFLRQNLDVTPLIPMDSARFWIDHRDSTYSEGIKHATAPQKPEIKVYNIAVPIGCITFSADAFIVIRMPQKGEFKGHEFTVSRKIVKEGRHSAEVILRFTEAFEFKMRAESKRHKYGKTVVATKFEIIKADTLLKAFGGNIESSSNKRWIEQEEEIIHTPKPLQPIEPQTDESLKR